jgi:hypothetical protein
MQSFVAHMPPSSLDMPASGNVKGGSMKGGGVDPPSSPAEPEDGGVLESSPGADPSSPAGGVVASSEVQEVQASSPTDDPDDPEELESSDPEPDWPLDPEPEPEPNPGGSVGELVLAQPAIPPPSPRATPRTSPSPRGRAKAPTAADTPDKPAFLWTSRSTREG